MPSEPENKMEELLKSYAKKRREEAGAPFELHPATRRLLRDEVAQQRRKVQTPRESWLSRLLVYWPRLAMAASILAALGIVGAVWLPRAERWQKMFAKSDSTPSPVQRDSHLMAGRAAPNARDDVSKRVAEKDGDGIVLAEVPSPTAPAQKESLGVETRRAVIDPKAVEAQAANGELFAGTERLDRAKAKLQLSSLALNQPVTGPEPRDGGTNGVALGYSLADRGALAGGLQAGVTSLAYSDKQPADRQAGGKPLTVALNEERSREGPANLGITTPAVNDSPTLMPPLPAVERKKATGPVTAAVLPADAPAPNTRPGFAEAKADRYFFKQISADVVDGTGGETSRLRFAQRPAPQRPRALSKATDPASPVLSRFEVQWEGEKVRLIDFDGSIYEGRLIAATDVIAGRGAIRAETGVQLRRQGEPAADKFEAARSEHDSFVGDFGSQNLSFHVSGTNRKLGELVIVEGTLLTGVIDENPRKALSATVAPASTAVPSRSVPPAPLTSGGNKRVGPTNALSVQRVMGTAKFGTNEFRLDAVRVRN